MNVWRRYCGTLLAALLLASCGNHQPLPPPGVGSTVAVHIWDPGASDPTVIVADRIRQEGLRIDRMLLDRVRARVLWPNLDCAVISPTGTWTPSTATAATGSPVNNALFLTNPVHLAGTYQGHPMVGVATSATLSRDGQTITLEHLEMWYQGDELTAPITELRRERGIIFPQGSTTVPLPEEVRALCVALPDPMVLPK